MVTSIPTKHIPNSQVRFGGEYRWTLEEGIEDGIKRDLGIEE